MRKATLKYTAALLLLTGLAYSQGQDSLPVFLPEDSCKIKVTRLSVNSDKSDYSPLLLNNTLLFASGRPARLGVSYTNETNTELTDLFYAKKIDSLHFGKARPFSTTINSKLNEGPFTLSADGNTIYFSGNATHSTEDKRTALRLQIYTSTKSGESWAAPEAAPFCSGNYSNCHPVFSKDNAIMVFCSDMPGGYGGTDLYYTTFKNNGWTPPVNFGPKINSAENELFPFISVGSTLYFSSRRAAGKGGLDIYSFQLKDSLTEKARLLDAPINTAFDDFGIWLDSAEQTGYFSSNRNAATGDDIFYFGSPYPDFHKATTPVMKTKFCYSFFEENAYQSTDSVSWSYEWDFGDGHKIRAEKCRYCFSKPGSYPVKLNIIEKNSGELFYNHATYTLTVEDPPGLYITGSDMAATDDEMILDASKSYLKDHELLGFFWAFGDGTYNRGKRVKHNYKKEGTYTLELGVTARNTKTLKIEKFKLEKTIVVKDNG